VAISHQRKDLIKTRIVENIEQRSYTSDKEFAWAYSCVVYLVQGKHSDVLPEVSAILKRHHLLVVSIRHLVLELCLLDPRLVYRLAVSIRLLVLGLYLLAPRLQVYLLAVSIRLLVLVLCLHPVCLIYNP
jgi:hypothetical protein